jgi:NAD+ synthetase
MFENVVQGGINYLEKYPNIETMVIGLSGGIDSALTAAIAREICDRTHKYSLIGVSIPIESNKISEIENAKIAGKAFCNKFIEIKIIDTIFKLAKRLFKTKKSMAEKIRIGNVKARMRMLTLYDIAHRNDGIVLSTDNLSEYNLGFWTLHGDVGDLGFIQQLWKTEVYGMSNYLCARYDRIILNSCWTGDQQCFKVARKGHLAWKQTALTKAIHAIPTDGLGVTESDFDQLGVKSYQEVDKILIEYISTGSKNKELEKYPVIERHLKYAFKRENPYNISREDIIPKPKPIVENLM